MRLGDLDALKDQINATDFDFGDYYDNTKEVRKRVCEVIDNAPTVEEVSEIEFKEPLPPVKAQKIVKALSKRSQGEWVAIEPYTHKTFCPFCKEDTRFEVGKYDNFCPNCGADLRGGDNE